MSLLSLVVQVLVQLRWVQLHFRSLLGHIEIGGPQDSVDDQTAEVLVAPVLVEVPAGEAEAAALVALERPSDDLLTALELLGRIGAALVVGWSRLENRRHVLRFGCE